MIKLTKFLYKNYHTFFNFFFFKKEFKNPIILFDILSDLISLPAPKNFTLDKQNFGIIYLK